MIFFQPDVGWNHVEQQQHRFRKIKYLNIIIITYSVIFSLLYVERFYFALFHVSHSLSGGDPVPVNLRIPNYYMC